MRRVAAQLLSAALLCGGVGPLAGCGDDEPQAVGRGTGGGGSAARRKPKPKAGAEGPATDESKLPVKLRGLKPADWEIDGDVPVLLREGRDPFLPYVADLMETRIEAEDDLQKRQFGLGITVAVPVDQLHLLAVITGTGVPTAMVKDGRGLGHIIRPGDVVGETVPYRVTRITRNQVVFKPLQAPDGEEQLKEVSKVLLTQEELEELLP